MFIAPNLNKIYHFNLLSFKRIIAPFLLIIIVVFPCKSQDANNGIKKIVIDPGHGGKDPGNLGTGRYKTTEKHIALDNQKKGLDIEFSLKGKNIGKFKKTLDTSYQLLGKKTFHRNKSESKNTIFRRSIFITKDIKKGNKFCKSNIRRIRPGYGVPPKYYEKMIGKRSPYNLFRGDPVKISLINKLKIK